MVKFVIIFRSWTTFSNTAQWHPQATTSAKFCFPRVFRWLTNAQSKDAARQSCPSGFLMCGFKTSRQSRRQLEADIPHSRAYFIVSSSGYRFWFCASFWDSLGVSEPKQFVPAYCPVAFEADSECPTICQFEHCSVLQISVRLAENWWKCALMCAREYVFWGALSSSSLVATKSYPPLFGRTRPNLPRNLFLSEAKVYHHQVGRFISCFWRTPYHIYGKASSKS